MTGANPAVWKAPAGFNVSLPGVRDLQLILTDLENGSTNLQPFHSLRRFKVYGDVVWGARTAQGNDQGGSQWKYVSIRRVLIESQLHKNTLRVLFEPNNRTLWGQIGLDIGDFLQALSQQGAFQGTTSQQAYFVKCDLENMPQSNTEGGVVNIVMGFAPLTPAAGISATPPGTGRHHHGRVRLMGFEVLGRLAGA